MSIFQSFVDMHPMRPVVRDILCDVIREEVGGVPGTLAEIYKTCGQITDTIVCK
ncbi:hypothetical protein [Pseudoflavonifractor sp. 60]|uniref:hypothetical protein n=1 Tax=Pseudoflavonifractor sp. 60 TaxID=2304576 RepID=UPI00191C5781|nr:hypothetical protein [Pseudoflavonifractor sp. 60]